MEIEMEARKLCEFFNIIFIECKTEFKHMAISPSNPTRWFNVPVAYNIVCYKYDEKDKVNDIDFNTLHEIQLFCNKNDIKNEKFETISTLFNLSKE